MKTFHIYLRPTTPEEEGMETDFGTLEAPDAETAVRIAKEKWGGGFYWDFYAVPVQASDQPNGDRNG